MNPTVIPVFYACDEPFIPYTVVSLYSMIRHASRQYRYRIIILHSGISRESQQTVLALADEHFSVSFEDVSAYLQTVSEQLPIRDYYSKTTYYRLFIADMFPEYEKAIYLDSDTVVQGDISELYATELGDAYVGACHEQAMVQVDAYGTYAERVVGVSRHNFFNAGVLLLNGRAWRQHEVLKKFVQQLQIYHFAVTQDEDYLNLICKDHVHWLDQRWNTEIFGSIAYPIEEARILHYIMVSKPWHYADCRHGDIFWRYAEQTAVYATVRQVLQSYTEEEQQRDAASMDRLLALAVSETEREDNYLNRINAQSRAEDRVAIIKKIEELERQGRFDEDVEEDPPTKALLPEDIEYLHGSVGDRLKTGLAFLLARRFVHRLLQDRKMIIREIRGAEHFQELSGGAVITCNHFHAFDSFAVQMAYEAAHLSGHTFYRVIREGNYTSYPGFYGFLMRNCNTLPLSSHPGTMQKFVEAVHHVLQDGHFLLVYPEQSMWWNYRKPKPLKPGAYTFAVRNRVPILPCFITMKDSDVMGEDGFFVQEYTVHIAAPIFPNESLPYRQRVNAMMEQNAAIWKQIYEEEYQIPLEYTTQATHA